MEVLPDRRGKPLVFLHGRAARRAAEIGLTEFAISLTHSRDLAIAFVVAS
jgi:holo-[acyl-carrier protein] synthase